MQDLDLSVSFLTLAAPPLTMMLLLLCTTFSSGTATDVEDIAVGAEVDTD
jgi:hypothetical protein